jgi:hypothetical protein
MSKNAEQRAVALIKAWDFESQERGGCLFSSPIPVSYQGNMSLEKIQGLLDKTDDRVKPFFSGDNQSIYCFDPGLAIEFIKNGHEFLPHLRREFKIY